MLPVYWRAAVRHRYVLEPAAFLYNQKCCDRSLEIDRMHFHAFFLLKQPHGFHLHSEHYKENMSTCCDEPADMASAHAANDAWLNDDEYF
jgi:hypothetical protein